jgi:hypothetical protein
MAKIKSINANGVAITCQAVDVTWQAPELVHKRLVSTAYLFESCDLQRLSP